MKIRISLVPIALVALVMPVNADDAFLMECRLYKASEADGANSIAPIPKAPGDTADLPFHGLVEDSIDGDDPDASPFFLQDDRLVWRVSEAGEVRTYEKVTSPSLMVLEDQTATLRVGQEIPYTESTDDDSSAENVQFAEVGTKVEVRVHAAEEEQTKVDFDGEIVTVLFRDLDNHRPRFSTTTWECDSAVPYGQWSFQRLYAANGQEFLSFFRVTRQETKSTD